MKFNQITSHRVGRKLAYKILDNPDVLENAKANVKEMMDSEDLADMVRLRDMLEIGDDVASAQVIGEIVGEIVGQTCAVGMMQAMFLRHDTMEELVEAINELDMSKVDFDL